MKKINFYRPALWLVMLAIVVQSSGCVSFFNSTEQVLTVTSPESDADIFINSNKYKTPAKVSVPRDKHVNVMVEKPGYTTFKTEITNSLSGCGVTDAISSIFLLIPIIGLLAPGAYELTYDHIDVKLYKK